MSELKIIDGKFYRDGVEVKPEFGNREQIKLLQDIEKLKNDKAILAVIDSEEITLYKPSLRFKCPSCNKNNFQDDYDPEEYEVECDFFEHDTINCDHCTAEFEVETDRDKPYAIKLIQIK